MLMLITDDIFHAFVQCETKAHLKLAGTAGDHRAFPEWERHLIEDYKRQCHRQWRTAFGEAACLVGGAFLHDLDTSRCRFMLDCRVCAQEMQSDLHAVERVAAPGPANHSPYMPIRCVPREKITPQDKLLLAFDALVLGTVSGEVPRFGQIIHGRKQATTKIEIAGWLDMAKTIVSKIAAQQANSTPPPLILNQYCAACDFTARCRQIALEKDEFSLLTSMTAKERQQQHAKGIFSVTQLSYTFRVRRKPKRVAAKPDKYSHALRALALREGKIHIAGRPALPIHGTPVYLDVEGVPDRDFYYLIGVRIKSGDAYVHYAFWANEPSEEQEIWAALLETLATIDHPQLIHYGSYETIFLQRMRARYRAAVEPPAFLDQLIAESINVLSVIYAQIYFPTYSNGLKEIAQYVGFHWSEANASGLHALRWRWEWERSHDASLKQKLITYNAEDCAALERVTQAVARLCRGQDDPVYAQENAIVHTDTMKRESPYHFGRNEFLLPEFADINKAAYWDYQREKIYIRSSPRLKRVSRKAGQTRPRALPVNKVMRCLPPVCCPKCQATAIRQHARFSKTVYDLKFGRAGVKRWIVQYRFARYACARCEAIFALPHRPWTRSKFGAGLMAYTMYHVIDLHVPQMLVVQEINQLFHLHLTHTAIHRLKSAATQRYQGTYAGILRKIVTGRLIHADETPVSIGGKRAYVWVFTTLEDVIYYYTKTREGDFLHEMLHGFKGVLVSDFYAAYDAMNCAQQKCLIHLMRDLHTDLLKQPFNGELKALVHAFALLLKPIIETVDRFGLTAQHLQKHKPFVGRFYDELSKHEYQSDLANSYKKRFEKNKGKLFTFLDYDGIPWNNNNAEHAIKAFASLRKVIGGVSTEKGIREYLTLLSVCETCKYKGVSFLDFLRSGEKDIDLFMKRGLRGSKESGVPSRLPE
jgi:predicted RecB family nuclease